MLQPDLMWPVAWMGWSWSGWAGVKPVGLVLDWLEWCWANVGLVGPALDWLYQFWAGYAGVSPVGPVSVQLCQCPAAAGGWQEVEEQDHAMGRVQQGVGEGALGALSRSVVLLKHFIKCFLSCEGLDCPGSACCWNSLPFSTKAPGEQPPSC